MSLHNGGVSWLTAWFWVLDFVGRFMLVDCLLCVETNGWWLTFHYWFLDWGKLSCLHMLV